MFGIDSIEIFIVAIAALIFIGPKELPGAMRGIGRWVGKIRGYARHFTSGIEAAMREAELEEMEKEWREQNERIMARYPDAGPGEEDAVMTEKDQAMLPLDSEEEDKRPPEERELP